jgi:hypothetical protein
MRLEGVVECRRVSQCRVQLGDPGSDIYEYQIYSFLEHRDFSLEQYDHDGADMACLISRQSGLVHLGHQYRLTLSHQGPGLPMVCEKVTPQRGCGQVVRLTPASHRGVWWTPTHITIITKHAMFEVDRTYYLDVPSAEIKGQ